MNPPSPSPRLIGRRSLIAAASLLAGSGAVAFAQQAKEDDAPEPKDDDVKSIDAIVAALYDVISGPKGQERDWDRFRSLFVPGARLIPTASRRGEDGATARVLTIAEFIQGSSAAVAQTGFFESELARTTEEFGHIAHAFSTYESRREKDAEPFTRGINSIQLLNDGRRWRVVTILWEPEREGGPLPKKYLPKS